jgi:hypothetical protein
MTASLIDQITFEIAGLTEEQRGQVLAFARSIVAAPACDVCGSPWTRGETGISHTCPGTRKVRVELPTLTEEKSS